MKCLWRLWALVLDGCRIKRACTPEEESRCTHLRCDRGCSANPRESGLPPIADRICGRCNGSGSYTYTNGAREACAICRGAGRLSAVNRRGLSR